MNLILSLLVASGEAHATVNVVTSTQDVAALATAVGGSDVTVNYIARGDLDPHFVDAKPSFMVKLASADLVLAVGMELEVGWMPNLLTGARNPKVAMGSPGYLDLSSVAKKIEVPSGSIDRWGGDLHPEGNPHYWLDPENGRLMARAIAAKLTSLDAAHSADYAKNLATFESQLTAKEATWAAKMAPLKGSSVIGYHSTFNYFCHVYGLNVVGFVEPKPGIPPTPAHTLEIGQAGKAAGVKWIFVEPYKDPKDAGPIASMTGAKVVSMPTSVGAESNIKTYLDLFDTLVARVAG
jgi:ABC-type Zn uptake system ZnuABC Zn-binding protein ZnuA